MESTMTSTGTSATCAPISGASQTIPLPRATFLLTGRPAGNVQHWKWFLRGCDVMTDSIAGLGPRVVRWVAM